MLHCVNQLLRLNLTKVSRIFVRYEHLRYSINARLPKSVTERYSCLPLPDCKTQATYVWLDSDYGLRSKVRTMDFVPSSHSECPPTYHDGRSTGLAKGQPSDILVCPVALYKDPLTKGKNVILLCETYDEDNKPSTTNNRYSCLESLNKTCDNEPWFGFEQEFLLMDMNRRPLGWPIMYGECMPVNKYYCGVGAYWAFAREIVDITYRCCLNSGIDLIGSNAEVTPSQWEFQTGPTAGIKAGDDLWMTRFILQRIAEDYGVAICLHGKPFSNWNGSGMHANFSTKIMREDGGIKCIEDAIEKLSKKHDDHIKVYDVYGGADNKLRLTGEHETCVIDKFSSGIGDRNASVRIPKQVSQEGKGYLEDRRPSANADPYLVMQALVKTCLLNE